MTTATMEARPKLTLAWRGNTQRLPDVTFVEVDAPTRPAPPQDAARQATPAAPARPAHYERIKDLLDRWAEWMSTDTSLAHGAPRQCHGAPDARIHSFEDMEIEVNKIIVRAVDTAVWELPILEREAVMFHYGFKTARAWKADFEILFDLAIDALFAGLKNRVAC